MQKSWPRQPLYPWTRPYTHIEALIVGLGRRDSKLTMLLKSSFERANSKVLLVTNISPISASFSEVCSITG